MYRIAKHAILLLAGAICSATLHAQPGVAPSPEPSAATVPTKQTLHIYLLMGQSNMVGRDTRSLGAQIDNPRVLAFTNDGRWVVAREPIHADERIPVGQGPGIPFAVEMLKDHPNETIGLVPCAVGGTPLRRWVKGADLYDNCLAKVKIAEQTGVIAGVLWHQGEADTTVQADAETYKERLTQMFRDLREDLGSPQLPIVVGQLGTFLTPEKYPYVDIVHAAIEHMPEALPHVGYADSAGLGDKGDRLHFSADAQTVFGARYAVAMQQATSGKSVGK